MPPAHAARHSAPTTPLTGYLLLFAGMSLVGTYVALSKPLTTVFPVFLLALATLVVCVLVLGTVRGLREGSLLAPEPVAAIQPAP